MSRLPVRSPATLLLIVSTVGFLLFGCDDDGVGPRGDSEPRLRGSIVDPQGGPVPDVVLSPLYSFDPPVGQPVDLSVTSGGFVLLKKLRTTIRFVIDSDGPTRLTVENALGDTLRTLIDGSLQSGDHEVTWATDRDDGTLVPNGVYTLVLWHDPPDGEPSEQRRDMFVLDVDPSSLARRPLAVTDGDGRFSVPMALIPVGYESEGYDVEADSMVTHRVLPRFRLYAFRLEGETVVGQSSTTVEILDPSRSKSIVVPMP